MGKIPGVNTAGMMGTIEVDQTIVRVVEPDGSADERASDVEQVFLTNGKMPLPGCF